MLTIENLDRLRYQALNLIQAMLGAISANFRMVSISLTEKGINLLFILEHESQQDREEIEDITSEFEALQSQGIEYEVETIISDEDIKLSKAFEATLGRSSMIVYRRRET